MNWTGGALERSRGSSSSTLAIQKRHFAKARARQRRDHESSPPVRIFEDLDVPGLTFNPKPSHRARSQRSQQIAREHYSAATPSRSLHRDKSGSVRLQRPGEVCLSVDEQRRPITISSDSPCQFASSNSGLPTGNKATASPDIERISAFEARKAKLLSMHDWVGISHTRPAKVNFTDTEDRDQIGKRRRFGKNIAFQTKVLQPVPQNLAKLDRLRRNAENTTELPYLDNVSVRFGSDVDRTQWKNAEGTQPSTIRYTSSISDEMLDEIYPVRTQMPPPTATLPKGQIDSNQGATQLHMVRAPLHNTFTPLPVHTETQANPAEAPNEQGGNRINIEGNPITRTRPRQQDRFVLGQPSRGSQPLHHVSDSIPLRIGNGGVSGPDRSSNANSEFSPFFLADHGPISPTEPSLDKQMECSLEVRVEKSPYWTQSLHSSPFGRAICQQVSELQAEDHSKKVSSGRAKGELKNTTQGQTALHHPASDFKDPNISRNENNHQMKQAVCHEVINQACRIDDITHTTKIGNDQEISGKKPRPGSSLETAVNSDLAPVQQESGKSPNNAGKGPSPIDEGEALWRSIIFGADDSSDDWMLGPPIIKTHMEIQSSPNDEKQPSETQPSMEAQVATSPIKPNPHLLQGRQTSPSSTLPGNVSTAGVEPSGSNSSSSMSALVTLNNSDEMLDGLQPSSSWMDSMVQEVASVQQLHSPSPNRQHEALHQASPYSSPTKLPANKTPPLPETFTAGRDNLGLSSCVAYASPIIPSETSLAKDSQQLSAADPKTPRSPPLPLPTQTSSEAPALSRANLPSLPCEKPSATTATVPAANIIAAREGGKKPVVYFRKPAEFRGGTARQEETTCIGGSVGGRRSGKRARGDGREWYGRVEEGANDDEIEEV